MGWSCRRPGCGREAEVCISYDALACQVWLDPIAMAPAGGQPLCADHAQRLSAPRGWVVLDRRTSQSTLMTSAGSVPAADARGRAAVPRRRLPRAWGQFDAPRLEFLAEDEAPTEPDPTFDVPAVATALLEPEPDPVEFVEMVETVEPELVEPELVEPEPVEPEPVQPEPGRRPDTVDFRTPETEEPETEAPEPEPVVEVLAPEPEPEPEPEPVVEVVAPEPQPAAKPTPRRRTTKSDAGPLGKPKGRLLSRAFEASGPQRSAITESLGGADEAAEG